MENTDSDEVDNLDNSDDLRKYYKYKICYKLKLDKEKEYTTKREYSEEVDNLDNSDDLRKGHKYKICYKLKLDNEKEYTTKRVIMKILKLDENNQYGYSMTKPLPTGCIKQDPDIIWRTFNLLLERVSLEDSIGYLFKVALSLIIITQVQNKEFIMKFTHQSQINKQPSIRVKDQFISCLSSILKLKKVTQGHIGRRKEHTQRCLKNFFPQCI